MTPNSYDRLLAQSEVCERLSISTKTLQKYRRTRKIAFIQLGYNTIRFRETAVQEFIRRGEQPRA